MTSHTLWAAFAPVDSGSFAKKALLVTVPRVSQLPTAAGCSYLSRAVVWRGVGALQVDDPAPASSVPPATIAAPTPVHCPSGPRLLAHVMPGARFGKTVAFIGPDLGFLQGCSYLFGLNKTGAIGGSVKHVRRAFQHKPLLFVAVQGAQCQAVPLH